jgi:HK97 family phage portal protein
MSLLAHLRGHETRTWSGPLTSSSPELARLWAAPSSSTGMAVNEETSYTYSVFWACVNNISTDVSSFPLNLYKREKDGGKTLLTDHKLAPLLHDAPNPEMTAFTFRGVLTSNALTWGMGYAEIVRDGAGRPVSLWPITPDRVTIRRQTTKPYALYYEVAREDGTPDRLTPEQMFILPGSTVDGIYGRNIVSVARESIGLGLAAERFGGTFFGNGATFGGVFNHPTTMTATALKNFRDSVNATHGGAEKAHKFIVTEEGMTYQKLGVDPNNAQFLETRQHQIEEMCRWFRMPPHKVQHLIRTSYNSVEQMNIEYSTDTLTPWCVRWEQELKRQLIAPSERRIQFFKHNMDSKLRGDTAARYAAYGTGVQHGFLSADDVREKEDMNPLPNGQGQVYLVPANMSPANRLDEIVDKQVAPDPKPVAPSPEATSDDDRDRALEVAREMETHIRAALAQVEGQVAAHVAKAVEAETRRGVTEQENLALEAAAEQHRQAADEALGRANALTATLALATERAAQLEREMVVARLEAATQADALRREAEEAARLVAVRESEAEALRASFESVNAAKAEVQASLAEAIAARTDLAFQVDQERAAREEAQRIADAETARLTADVEAAKAQAAQLEHDRQAMEQTGMAASLVIAQLQAQLADIEARRAEATSAQLTEREAAETAKAELARLQAEQESALRTVALLEAEQAKRDADAAVTKAEMEAAHQEREQTRADLEKVTLAAAESALALQEVTARANAEAVTRAERTEEVQRLRDMLVSSVQAIGKGHREMVAKTVGLWVQKEVERARRNQLTPAKLIAWADGFYLLHVENCIDAIRPVMRAHLALIGSTADVDIYTRNIVRPHLDEAIAQLRAVAGGDPEDFAVSLERLLTRWERERPAAIVERVLEEEVAYVRSL